MLTIQEFLEETQLLKETAGLGRFWQHMTNEENAFAIITAFRPPAEKSKEQSEEDNQVIAKAARRAGFGYKWVDGGWIENEGKPNEEHLAEVSLFIMGDTTDKLWDFCLYWGKKYEQYSFVYKGPGAGTRVNEYSPTGSKIRNFTKLHMDRISKYHTKVRGGPHDGRPWFYDTTDA